MVGALLVCGAGCDDDPNLVDRELVGAVSDLTSGAPLEDARVVFTSETRNTTETTTGGDGGYELQLQTSSPFGQLRAERSGYEPSSATVFFDTSSRTLDLQLRRQRE